MHFSRLRLKGSSAKMSVLDCQVHLILDSILVSAHTFQALEMSEPGAFGRLSPEF